MKQEEFSRNTVDVNTYTIDRNNVVRAVVRTHVVRIVVRAVVRRLVVRTHAVHRQPVHFVVGNKHFVVNGHPIARAVCFADFEN